MSNMEQQTKLPKGIVKAIVAGSMGNVVEWIDWSIYGLASPFIAQHFFPSDNPTTSLLQAFGVFAIGFLVRPFGAMVLGPYGDKAGRNKALAVSIILMALGTGLIGILPSYASIGLLAPVLLLFFRLVQGFAAGGEWGAATAFIYELAPPNRRAFVSSFRPTGTGLGFFLGSFIITLCTMVFSPEVLKAWAWRVPFVFGFLTGLLGLYIRLQVEESPEFLKAKANKLTSEKPLTDTVKRDQRGIWVVFGLAMVWNVVYYILMTWMPAYLKTVVGLPFDVAMKVASTGTLFYTVMIPVFGWLADKYNKKMMLTVSCLGYIFLTYPAFLLMNSGNYIVIFGVILLFCGLMAIYSGAVPVVIAEQFPTRTRNTGMSLAYTLNVSLLGGTAPMVCTWLSAVTGNPVAPAFYMIAATIVNYVAVISVAGEGRKQPQGLPVADKV